MDGDPTILTSTFNKAWNKKKKKKNLNMVVEELVGVMFPVSTNKVFES